MTETIQDVLAPAVMISAAALICLAQFARFTAVVAQLRSLHNDRFAICRKLSCAEPDERELLINRAECLELQSVIMLAHANTVKNALRFLVSGLLLMVLGSLTVGASLVYRSLSIVVIVLFTLALFSLLSGLYLVLAELKVSLEAMEFEQEQFENF